MRVFTVLAGAGGCFIRQTVSGLRPSTAPPRRAASAGRAGDTILGRAYVADRGGVRAAGWGIRIAGLDMPGYDRFDLGRRASGALMREIGGEPVRVAVEGADRHGRLLATVTCEGRDIGEWPVRGGHASAGRYARVEREAWEAGRGMWARARAVEPGDRRREGNG